MKLFIDTANPDQIRDAWSWGIIDGVTTNPTHVVEGRAPGARRLPRDPARSSTAR